MDCYWFDRALVPVPWVWGARLPHQILLFVARSQVLQKEQAGASDMDGGILLRGISRQAR